MKGAFVDSGDSAGYWQLVIGYWQLVIAHRHSFTSHYSPFTFPRSLLTGRRPPGNQTPSRSATETRRRRSQPAKPPEHCS